MGTKAHHKIVYPHDNTRRKREQMAKEYAKEFYNSKAWKECREAYKKSVGGICERCSRQGLISPAEIVHHKIRITPDNIKDPCIVLSWGNLEALCRNCHAEEHARKRKRRYEVDEHGRVIGI